jgi:uncharacterized membrane protein
MYTYENLLHFMHVFAAIVWVGGVLTLNVLAVRVGRGLVREIDLPLSTLWVAWGLIGLAFSVALGATLIRATNADLRRLTEGPSTDESRRLARQRRAALLYGINVLMLLSVVWVMVFKPTL